MTRRVETVLAAALATSLLAACAGETDRAQGVRLVEGTRSDARFPDADLRFEAPEPGASLEQASVEVRLALDGFELGAPTPGAQDRGLALSDKGQHVHFILDNEPYRALYSLDEPVELSGLEPGATSCGPSRRASGTRA